MGATYSPSRYDPVAVTLHWVIAFCILLMIPMGFLLDLTPDWMRYPGFTLHKSIGITVLALSITRLIWRLMNPPPALPATVSAWERRIAKLTHWLFYVLIIAMPLSGWLMVSASQKYPTIFFWMGEVPFIPMPEGADVKALRAFFGESHEWLAIGTAVLLVLHVGAALKHHFVEKDGVLRAMLPRGSSYHS